MRPDELESYSESFPSEPIGPVTDRRAIMRQGVAETNQARSDFLDMEPLQINAGAAEPQLVDWIAEPMRGLPEAVNPYATKTVLIEDLLFDGQGLKVRENDRADYKVSAATNLGDMLGIYPIPGGCPMPLLNNMIPSSFNMGTKGVLYQPHRSTGYFLINKNQWLHCVSFQTVKQYNATTQQLITTGYVQFLKHMDTGTLYFVYYDLASSTYRVARAKYQDGRITEEGRFEAKLLTLSGDTGVLGLDFTTHSVCVFRVEPILVAPQPAITNATSSPINTQLIAGRYGDFMDDYQWTTDPARQALVLAAPTTRHYGSADGVAASPLNSHYIGVGCIDGDGATSSSNATPNYWTYRYGGGSIVANQRLLTNPVGARESVLPNSNTEFSKAPGGAKRLSIAETPNMPMTVSNSWDVYREDGYYWDIERNLETHFLGVEMALDDRGDTHTSGLSGSGFTFPLRTRNMTPAPYRLMTYTDNSHLEFRISAHMPAYNEWCYYIYRFLKDPFGSARVDSNYLTLDLTGIKQLVFPYIAAYGLPEQDSGYIRIGFLRLLARDGLKAYPRGVVSGSSLQIQPPSNAVPTNEIAWSLGIEPREVSWGVRRVPIRHTATVMDFYEWRGRDVAVLIPDNLTDVVGLVIAVYVRGSHGANDFVYGGGVRRHTMRGNAGNRWADEPQWSISHGWGSGSSTRTTYWAFANDHVWHHLALRFPKGQFKAGSRTQPSGQSFHSSVRYGWGYVQATGRMPRGPKTYIAVLFYGNTPGIASNSYTYTSSDGQPVKVTVQTPPLEDIGVPVTLVLYRAVEGGWKAVAEKPITNFSITTHDLLDLDDDKGRPLLNVTERLPYGHTLSLYDRLIVSDDSLLYGSNVGDWISFTRYPATNEDGFLMALPEDIRALSIRGGSVLGIGQHRHYRLLLDQALTAAYLPLEPETVYAFTDLQGRTVTDTAFLTEDTLWVGNRPAFLLGRRWRQDLKSAWVQPTPLGVYLVLEYNDRVEVYEPAQVQEGYVRGILKKADIQHENHSLKSVSWTGALNLIWSQKDSADRWATIYRRGAGNRVQGRWVSGYSYIPTNHYLSSVEYLGEWNTSNPLEWRLRDPHGRVVSPQPNANILEGLTPRLDGRPVEAVGLEVILKENQRLYGAVAQLERGGLW